MKGHFRRFLKKRKGNKWAKAFGTRTARQMKFKFAGPFIYFFIIGDYFVFLLFRLMIYSTKSINMTPVGREIQALCVKPATI